MQIGDQARAGDGSLPGRGWSFRPAFSKSQDDLPTLRAEMVEGIASIEQSIRIILSTIPGEPTMQPSFGCPLVDVLFHPVDASTQATIEERVRAALERFEPRVEVNTVRAEVRYVPEGHLEIGLVYTVRATGSSHNLVCMFGQLPLP